MAFTYELTAQADLRKAITELKELRGETKEFAAQAAKSSARSMQAFKAMSSSMAVSGAAAVAVMAKMAATAAGSLVSSLTNAVQSGAEFSAQIRGMSESLGLATSQFSAAAGVLGEFGLGADETFDVLGEISQRAVNNAADFQRWGISTREANGTFSDSLTLLSRVADATSNLEDETQQMALADELLSDAGRRLIPLLREGGQAFLDKLDAVRATRQMVTEYEGVVAEALVRRQKIAAQQVRSVGSALSGVLGPALSLITKELGNAASRVAEFIRENREMINAGIDQFLASIGEVWIPRIVDGLIFATRAGRGFSLIWKFLQRLGASAMETLVGGLANLISMAARAAEMLGQDGLAASLRNAADTQSAVAESFAQDQRKIDEEISQSIENQVQLEAQLRSFGRSSTEALNRVRANLADYRQELQKVSEEQDRVKTGSGRVADADEEASKKSQEAEREKQRQLRETLRLKREQEREEQRIARERAKRAAEERRLIDENRKALEQQYSSILSYGREVIQGLIDGSMSLRDVMTKVSNDLIDLMLEQLASFLAAKATEQAVTTATAKANIVANAAEASSGAIKSQAGIPVVGPILAVAAGAAILAAVLALASGLNQGGVVSGLASSNRDSVPAMLTPGELVVDRETTARLAGLLASGGGSTGGGNRQSMAGVPMRSPARGGGGGEGGITVQVLSLPESRVEQTRLARRLERTRRRV